MTGAYREAAPSLTFIRAFAKDCPGCGAEEHRGRVDYHTRNADGGPCSFGKAQRPWWALRWAPPWVCLFEDPHTHGTCRRCGCSWTMKMAEDAA